MKILSEIMFGQGSPNIFRHSSGFIGATTVGTGGDWSPTFRLGGPTMYWFPQLLGRSFQKARNFTTSSHQNAGFSIWIFKKIPGVIPRTLTAGGGDSLLHPAPSPAFGRERGASATVLGPKPWSPSTFQPRLRLCPDLERIRLGGGMDSPIALILKYLICIINMHDDDDDDDVQWPRQYVTGQFLRAIRRTGR